MYGGSGTKDPSTLHNPQGTVTVTETDTNAGSGATAGDSTVAVTPLTGNTAKPQTSATEVAASATNPESLTSQSEAVLHDIKSNKGQGEITKEDLNANVVEVNKGVLTELQPNAVAAVTRT
jgi:hypothetical protein